MSSAVDYAVRYSGPNLVYMQNYDAIVKSVSLTDARRAHRVAAEAFDRTIRCARRSGNWWNSRRPDSRRRSSGASLGFRRALEEAGVQEPRAGRCAAWWR
jgi:hypothetical protein